MGRLLRINWRGFARDAYMALPVDMSGHFVRPAGAVLCDSQMCHRCRALERAWRFR